MCLETKTQGQQLGSYSRPWRPDIISMREVWSQKSLSVVHFSFNSSWLNIRTLQSSKLTVLVSSRLARLYSDHVHSDSLRPRDCCVSAVLLLGCSWAPLQAFDQLEFVARLRLPWPGSTLDDGGGLIVRYTRRQRALTGFVNAIRRRVKCIRRRREGKRKFKQKRWNVEEEKSKFSFVVVFVTSPNVEINSYTKL